MSSIASTSESSSGVIAPTPALLTSIVMPRVGAQQRFDAAEIGLVAEVGRDDFDRAAGLVRETLCQAVEAFAVARHQDQVVAALRQPVGVDRADAGGSAGDEGGAFGVGSGHVSQPFVVG